MGSAFEGAEVRVSLCADIVGVNGFLECAVAASLCRRTPRVSLKRKTNLSLDPAIAGGGTPARAETKTSGGCCRQTELRRTQVTDWLIQIGAVQQILNVD